VLGIVAQNLGSWQMAATLSHLRHCFVRPPTFAIVLVVLLSAYPSRADLHQHPVLLPANVDPSKCFECHKDKATAFAADCWRVFRIYWWCADRGEGVLLAGKVARSGIAFLLTSICR